MVKYNYVIKVKPREDYTVEVYFSDGRAVLYDMKPLINSNSINSSIAEKLRDKETFRDICTIMYGTLAWDLSEVMDESNCFDINPNTLYHSPKLKNSKGLIRKKDCKLKVDDYIRFSQKSDITKLGYAFKAKIDKYSRLVVKVVDCSNKSNRATLVSVKGSSVFRLTKNTFKPKGAKLYEMLYAAEVTKKVLYAMASERVKKLELNIELERIDIRIEKPEDRLNRFIAQADVTNSDR